MSEETWLWGTEAMAYGLADAAPDALPAAASYCDVSIFRNPPSGLLDRVPELPREANTPPAPAVPGVPSPPDDADRALALSTELAEAQASIARMADELTAAMAEAALVPQLRAELESLEKDVTIERMTREHRTTPALSAYYAAQPLAAFRAWATSAPEIAFLRESHSPPVEEPLKHNGKTWAQMDFQEKHDLYHQNHELYEALKGLKNP